jgi:hypothetical protein
MGGKSHHIFDIMKLKKKRNPDNNGLDLFHVDICCAKRQRHHMNDFANTAINKYVQAE